MVTCAAVLGQRRHQRHRGRATADHHHPPAGVLEVGRPELGMHEPAPELVQPGELRLVAAVVVVVAGAGVEEGAGVAAFGGRAGVGMVDAVSTVHRASSDDQLAATTVVWNRRCGRTPRSAAVSAM